MTTKKIDPQVLARAADAVMMRQVEQRPVHVHMCPAEGGHRWSCPSPYCENVNARPAVCPGHGGELPRDTTAFDFGGE